MESKDKKEKNENRLDNGSETQQSDRRKHHLVSVSGIKRYLKENKLQSSKTYFNSLHDELTLLINKSVERAKANGRSRLLKKDL